MGLDMYLSKDFHVTGYDFYGEEAQKKYRAIMDIVGWEPNTDTPSADVNVTVAYWRKANAIHKWFVDKVQGGIDECQKSDVSLEELLELRDLCQDVLDKSNELELDHWKAYAEERLPSASGFFFGDTDYDEWYINDLKSTIEQIDKIRELSKPELDKAEEWLVKQRKGEGNVISPSTDWDAMTPESTINFVYQSSW